jgi:hypothetical protein
MFSNAKEFMAERPFLIHVFMYVIIFVSLGLIIKGATNEAGDRKEQNCQLFESDNLQDVRALKATYDYIEALNPDEIQSTINQFIIVSVPDAQIEAATDQAPDYCDDPGVALPEPDPKVPEEKDFSNLLNCNTLRDLGKKPVNCVE